jgi:hypothetical protein
MNEEIPVLERLRTELVGAVSRRRETGASRGRLPRRWLIPVAATATTAIVAVVAIVQLSSDTSTETRPRTGLQAPGVPESPIGGGMASCLEPFSVENLGTREFAFDGIIRSISVPKGEPDRPTLVTFDVTHWYAGGSGDTVELKTYERPGEVTSASLGQEDAVQLAEGQRVLASGEDDFLWSCGFSMLYTPNNAELFRAAFE